jgi:hypothetical protein
MSYVNEYVVFDTFHEEKILLVITEVLYCTNTKFLLESYYFPNTIHNSIKKYASDKHVYLICICHLA